MNRTALLRSLIDPQRLGLEIGPGFNPLLPKREGFRVETLDHTDRTGLVAKYRNAPGVDIDRIEEVDHVCGDGDVLRTVNRPGRYAWIVASHVIEHTTDLVGFLKDCETLLEDEGVLALAIPDKRYSFDALRPLTSTGDVLQAHLERRRRHPPGRVFDEVASNVLREGALAWAPQSDGPLAFFRSLPEAKELFDMACGSDTFLDIHAWQFTPSSFRLVLQDLHAIGWLRLREAQFFGDRGGEFMVSLSRQGNGPGQTRLALAQAAIVEQRAIRTPGLKPGS
jgi:hypothetical protein